MHSYDTDFYRYVASFAVRSAEQTVVLLISVLPMKSVVDFGCGEGAWLSVWAKAGAEVVGVDGDYVDRQRLMVGADRFHAADLSRPIDLGRQFDLVQSLEVAEHLPAASADGFVETLTRHGPIVMFSAAVPGQGGEHHINEQPLEYWRERFRARGYVPVDYIRPQVAGNLQVQIWYRCNMLLYVDEERLGTLPEALLRFRVPDHERLRDYWSLTSRVQQAIVRRLPRGAVDRISRVKTKLLARA
jgi:SAM-dependent methyltransferase